MNYEHVVRVLGGPAPGLRTRDRHLSEPLAARLTRAVRTYLRHRRDYRRLLEKPDYLLRDIGLTREQVIEKLRPFPF